MYFKIRHQACDNPPERWRMIHLDQMGNFMRCDVVQNTLFIVTCNVAIEHKIRAISSFNKNHIPLAYIDEMNDSGQNGPFKLVIKYTRNLIIVLFGINPSVHNIKSVSSFSGQPRKTRTT